MMNSSSGYRLTAMMFAAVSLAALTGHTQSPDSDKIIGSLKWEIVEETTGKALGKGNGPVHFKDVTVSDTRDSKGSRLERKRIQLDNQFTLEFADAPVANNADKKGFGVAVQCKGISCFGWEWFPIQGSKKAAKLKESGELGIDIKQVGSDWEITRTDFTTDVSLRVFRTGVDSADGKPFWRINIMKGSTIVWPSAVNGKVIPN